MSTNGGISKLSTENNQFENFTVSDGLQSNEFNGRSCFKDKDGYMFMRIRASLVPIVNFSSYAGYFAILLGCIFGAIDLIWVGILCEVVILLFQFVTLPVEFNASRRALKLIKEYNFFTDKELRQGRVMLRAAAMTYVASVASTLIQILRLVLMFTRRND